MDIQEELKKYFPQMEKQLNKEELEDFIHSEYKDLSQFHFGTVSYTHLRIGNVLKTPGEAPAQRHGRVIMQ